ncbi:MAG: biotin--[acetyl-CoA-carboxylase] ligase, partial [Alphaproteobacteria bacterium]
ATSLRQAGAVEASVEAMLERFVDRFEYWRACWRARGLDAVREAWLGRAARLGEKIVVGLPADRLEGRFAGLDDSGALILELADGGRRTITAGDVLP